MPDEVKAGADQLPAALALMQANPSVIKRPVLDANGKISVGFVEADWAERLLK
ncbi:hypothetical protein OK026_06600 [Chromobacterium haemolyticum]|nr:ArsC/Spx/MgsR family protein [Chromobacterium haemolyticum]WON86068.1 hypothetical protein OK026_06600 [Chromobacterium haemolyticum]